MQGIESASHIYIAIFINKKGIGEKEGERDDVLKGKRKSCFLFFLVKDGCPRQV